ncbi:MAGE family-domain-containing protein [Trametes maxima]|nr:MAGE family-domain-containing protein [Trametes maxima]
MARQSTRSQRPSQPSQSQPPRATQGGRARRGRAEEDSEEEQGYENEQGEIAAEKVQQEVQRKAQDLVRLALFHEQRRIPLKRDEISKKVLGTNSRSFNVVFAAANDILQKAFGMALVELHSTPNDKEISEKDAEMLKNTGVKRKSASTGTKNYILRSTLDAALIEKACTPDPEIRELEQGENPDANEEFAEDDNPVGTRSTGSLFAWHTADELASAGVLYVVLALILVEGKVISDNDLRAILKRLQLPANAPVPLSSQSSAQALTIDAHLAHLARQGFLEKSRIGGAGPGGGSGGAGRGGKGGSVGAGKRVRASQHAHDDSVLAAYEWRWGPRAHAEVGERAAALFVAEFMAVRPGEDDGDEDAVAAPRDAGAQRRVETLFKGIERAVSGVPLSDVR